MPAELAADLEPDPLVRSRHQGDFLSVHRFSFLLLFEVNGSDHFRLNSA